MQGSTIRFVHANHNGECATAEWEEAAMLLVRVGSYSPIRQMVRREMPERGKTSETSSSML